MDDPPSVSIVIASRSLPPFVHGCLESLEGEVKELNAEVLVSSSSPGDKVLRLQQNFPWVRVLTCETARSIPALRRYGVEHARGEIVAIIEQRCRASTQWLHSALAAHSEGHYGVVGGPIGAARYTTLRDWAVYFSEYHAYLPSEHLEDRWRPSSANAAYRRDILLGRSVLLDSPYWESSLHPVLHREGIEFRSVPEMIVYKQGGFQFADYLRQRYWFSRAFAGERCARVLGWRRWSYLMLMPVVPAIVLARIATRVAQRQYHVGQFALSLPLIIVAMAVLAAGEAVGCLAGPADALSKVE